MSELITKLGSKNYQVDLTNNRIDFLDTRFYLHENGQWYPSATTILDAYPKSPGFYEWLKKVGEDADQIRDEAGDKGSRVHRLTEKYDIGEEVCLFDELGNISVKMIEWAMFERYIEFKNRMSIEVVHSEMHIVSDKLKFGGTLDRIITLNGKTYLIDIKTGNNIYPHFWLQLAAYENLLTDSLGYNPVEEAGILWLNAKTKTDGRKGSIQGQGWQLITRDHNDTDKDWSLFQATHQLWLAENETMQPKQFSYSLKHKQIS